jgi:hypothetical protein
MQPSNIVLGRGETTIVVGERSLTLRPTLGAAIAISRAHGGLLAAAQRVSAADVNAMASIVAAGAGVTDAGEIDAVTRDLFLGGLAGYAAPLTDYVTTLLTGDQTDADGEEEGKSGNG